MANNSTDTSYIINQEELADDDSGESSAPKDKPINTYLDEQIHIPDADNVCSNSDLLSSIYLIYFDTL